MTDIKKIKPPVATYRLQLHKDFTLEDAKKIVSYLSELNISHVYLSPMFESTPGSTHGYDISDFSRISEERGGEEALMKLDDSLASQVPPMKILMDIVPNHMAVTHLNPYFFDILKEGQNSKYWRLFDLRVPEDQKIHLPVLAKSLDQTIEEGELSIKGKEGSPVFDFNGRLFPLNVSSMEELQKIGASPQHADIARLLSMQNYALVPWTESFNIVSYRRFFDIFDLIGVRVEDEEFFKLSHAKIVELSQKLKSFYGVRVDHIDGLADPAQYLQRLNTVTGKIWVEKILEAKEELEREWPALGTTGYEFMHYANTVFTHAGNFEKISDFWRNNIESRWKNFEDCVFESKRYVLETLFSSELKRISELSAETEQERHQASIFWMGISMALSTYRTYFASDKFSEKDRELILKASEKATSVLGDVYQEAADIYLPRLLSPKNDKDAQIMKEWQQLSGPAMAKGLEDTAHYRYVPLTALNEVGCSPAIEDNGVEMFSDWINNRAAHWPLAINATSTHDTKRSEDARCRLYALADDPERWFDFYKRASGMNKKFCGSDKGQLAPGPAVEYFIYQAIIATWPLDNKLDDDYSERICNYLEKSGREARDHTTWFKPNKPYEEAIKSFIENILNNQEFQSLLEDYMRDVARAGAINSLSLQALKILSPGVPDFYQGSELWDFSLVDPDNRRSVDYDLRQSFLSQKNRRDSFDGQMVENWKDGGIKLSWIKTLLDIRKSEILPQFHDAKVTPLSVTGAKKDHVAAFRIATGHKSFYMVCPRFPLLLLDESSKGLSLARADWNGTKINFSQDDHGFTNIITRKKIDSENASNPAMLFQDFPVAVLR